MGREEEEGEEEEVYVHLLQVFCQCNEQCATIALYVVRVPVSICNGPSPCLGTSKTQVLPSDIYFLDLSAVYISVMAI